MAFGMAGVVGMAGVFRSFHDGGDGRGGGHLVVG